MSPGLFVTGTDTGCGKTYVAAALIRLLRGDGQRVAGFKPVAAGADVQHGELRNADAVALSDASGLDLAYASVNPICLPAPVAPHIAAAETGTPIAMSTISEAFRSLRSRSDFVVAEGAGGWAVPLAPGLDTADLVRALGLPVVLVVGLRLGCINHARLTERAIRADGVPLLGWIGSQIDPCMARPRENLDTLSERLDAPLLGVFAHESAGDSVTIGPPTATGIRSRLATVPRDG